MSRPELRESLEGERRHLVRVSEAAIRCGVAEHYVRMEEEQGRQVGQAMLAFAAEMGWSLGDPRVQAAGTESAGPSRSCGSRSAPWSRARRRRSSRDFSTSLVHCAAFHGRGRFGIAPWSLSRGRPLDRRGCREPRWHRGAHGGHLWPCGLVATPARNFRSPAAFGAATSHTPTRRSRCHVAACGLSARRPPRYARCSRRPPPRLRRWARRPSPSIGPA
jgi:hypothetical protein